MGMAAGIAENPCDPEEKGRIPLPDFPRITSVPDQAAEMAAGTGKESQINGIDRIVVKILRNGVAVFCLNGYHSSVWRNAMRMSGRQGLNFGRGDPCLLFSGYSII